MHGRDETEYMVGVCRVQGRNVQSTVKGWAEYSEGMGRIIHEQRWAK